MLEERVEFWLRKYGDAPALLLETDRPRVHPVETRVESVALELPASLEAALEAVAAARETTLGALLCAAFAALAQRHTGSVDFCLAAELPEAAVLRLDLDRDPSFVELLAGVTLAIAESRAVGIPQPELAARQALCNLAFSCDAAQAEPHRFDIALRCVRGAAGTSLRWEYNALLFERASLERIATHYERLLQGVAADASLPLSRLPLTNESERAHVVALGQGPRRPYERQATIWEVFAAIAERMPAATAVAGGAGRLSYRELAERSDILATRLRRLGVAPGAAVGVALDRSIDLPVALLGILKAGGAYVPLDPGYPAERLAFIVADASVGLILTHEATRPALSGHGARVLCLDAAGDDDAGAAQPPAPDVNGASRGSDAPAYITYTSGSTGRAKGVAVTQRAVLRLVRNTNFLAVTPDDAFLHFAPVAFDASTLEIWAPLLNGARLVVAPPGLLSIAELGETVERFEVTTLWLTTALFQRMVDAKLPSFRHLRCLVTGGDVASPAHVRRCLETYPACRLVNGYGPTENTTFSTTHDITASDAAGSRVPIGAPIANSSAYVLDAHLVPVPVGVPGELCVGGDGVARGYLNLPELTAERFVPDPFSEHPAAKLYRTGDRVRWRGDGVLEFLGRTDDQVKIRGHRIELGEIELALQAHEQVRDACVVVGERGPGEKVLVAYVLFADDARVDEGSLRAHLGSKLPPYMIPSRITQLDRFPEHSSGKVDRVALSRTASEPERRTTLKPAGRRSAPGLQHAIAEVWRDVLGGAEPPLPDENFFDAGGDSLQLLSVQVQLEQRLHLKVSVLDLFEHTTVRKLAAFAEAQGARSVATS